MIIQCQNQKCRRTFDTNRNIKCSKCGYINLILGGTLNEKLPVD